MINGISSKQDVGQERDQGKYQSLCDFGTYFIPAILYGFEVWGGYQ